MIVQFTFLVFLHTLGTLFALPWRKSIPLPFILVSGILWGGLFWVLGSIALLITGIPYQRLTAALFFGLLTAILLAWNIRRKHFSFLLTQWRSALVWTGIPLAIFALSSAVNFTYVTPDSFFMTLNGRAFSSAGFSLFVREQLALRGVFVQALQAASPLLAQDYLYALQPAFTLVSAVLFLYLGWLILKQITLTPPPVWPFAVGLLGLAGTYLITFQTVYLHTNLLSGCYLMAGIACFWLAVQGKNDHWLVFGGLAMMAFSLMRNEAPVFALLFYALLYSNTEIPYKVRLAAYLPFGLPLIGWYLYLLAGAAGSYILSPARILVIVLALAGFGGLVGLSRLRWIETRLLPRLHWLLLLGVVGVYILLYALDPSRVQIFSETLMLNMTVYGLWGITWFFVAAAAVLAAALPQIPYQRIFSFGIPAFMILLLSVATQNVDYKLEWSDSANRMLSHILPSIFLYGSVLFTHAYYVPVTDIAKLRGSRAPLLIALGSGILVFILVLAFVR